jgi:hypothetical protein
VSHKYLATLTAPSVLTLSELTVYSKAHLCCSSSSSTGDPIDLCEPVLSSVSMGQRTPQFGLSRASLPAPLWFSQDLDESIANVRWWRMTAMSAQEAVVVSLGSSGHNSRIQGSLPIAKILTGQHREAAKTMQKPSVQPPCRSR